MSPYLIAYAFIDDDDDDDADVLMMMMQRWQQRQRWWQPDDDNASRVQAQKTRMHNRDSETTKGVDNFQIYVHTER